MLFATNQRNEEAGHYKVALVGVGYRSHNGHSQLWLENPLWKSISCCNGQKILRSL